MKAECSALPEVIVLEPRRFPDERGHFMETYRQDVLDEVVGKEVRFVQDNQSHSRRGVLRGLHFQTPPRAQGKLVRVLVGQIFDVAVDVRRSSTTFANWVGVELSASNCRQLWIPPGFAHGFLVLSDSADVLYKTTDFYSPADEVSVHWADPTIAIDWPAIEGSVVISAKDASAPPLREARLFS